MNTSDYNFKKYQKHHKSKKLAIRLFLYCVITGGIIFYLYYHNKTEKMDNLPVEIHGFKIETK